MTVPKILTDEMAKATAGNSEPYILDGKTYYLMQEPYADQDCYTANAVRVGDSIEDGEVETHDLHWNLLTPKELGYRTCDSTVIAGDSLDVLSQKYGVITVADDGQYIPIKSPIVEDGMTSCMSVRFNDELDDDGDIRIYNLSWFKSKDEISDFEIRHGDDQRQVVLYAGIKFLLNDCDCQAYQPFCDNDWFVDEENACDWDRPNSVTENVGTVEVKFPVKEKKAGVSR